MTRPVISCHLRFCAVTFFDITDFVSFEKILDHLAGAAGTEPASPVPAFPMNPALDIPETGRDEPDCPTDGSANPPLETGRMIPVTATKTVALTTATTGPIRPTASSPAPILRPRA